MEIDKNVKNKVADLFENQPKNMAHTLGIDFLKISREELIAEMPVDSRTVQPFRILHGGASVVLAETLCSIGGWLNIPDTKTAVGIEINANHHRSVAEGGKVIAVAKPIQIGRTLHVWETKINDDRGKLVCTSRCTLAIIDRK
jgi:1,4-dihydroxy-2-naphthoyl-CoA hydrolase